MTEDIKANILLTKIFQILDTLLPIQNKNYSSHRPPIFTVFEKNNVISVTTTAIAEEYLYQFDKRAELYPKYSSQFSLLLKNIQFEQAVH